MNKASYWLVVIIGSLLFNWLVAVVGIDFWVGLLFMGFGILLSMAIGIVTGEIKF